MPAAEPTGARILCPRRRYRSGPCADAGGSGEFLRLPPILVQESNSRIVDGMHRFEAAKIRGEQTIQVRLINCTDEDAFILAVKANTWHGLPLSRADRMTGARQIVQWHPDWSDRAIGVATGLSAKTIAGIRRDSADFGQQLGKRLGRDGKRRPLTAAEGRRRAAEYIAVHPEASLRESPARPTWHRPQRRMCGPVSAGEWIRSRPGPPPRP
ncbi:ParB N-terminal domain-containing protein [Streptacidiphilus sp. 4-A2]|nr:ParB N-terminal domain-containing protein [Streptacidiphilus sp. 4-A2]